jgi:hypothetical protein
MQSKYLILITYIEEYEIWYVRSLWIHLWLVYEIL